MSISGCTSSGTAITPNRDQPATIASPRPSILIGQEAIGRDSLWPILAEMAGAEAIREVVLDRAIEEELRRRGLSINEDAIEAERQRLISRLAPDANEAQQREIERRVLDGRGLGPNRLGALLRRNAGLRLLVRDQSEPTPEMVELAFHVRYGPRRETRIITTATTADAQHALDEIRSRADETGLLAAFAEVGATMSTDPSAALGGRLGAISVEDPGLPVALRRVLNETPVMQLSRIIAMDSGFAILLVERDVEPEPVSIEDMREALELDVRERQQRLHMDELARRLLIEHAPTVLDPSLRWSWDRRDGR